MKKYILSVSLPLFLIFISVFVFFKFKKLEEKIEKLQNQQKYIFAHTSGGIKNISKARGSLRERQVKLIKNLKKFDQMAAKHQIKYWIDFGVLLGSVRHNGFIPWDDDLDVSMTEHEFERLKKLVAEKKIDAKIHTASEGWTGTMFFFDFNDGTCTDIFVHSCMSEENYKKQIFYTKLERILRFPGFAQRALKNMDKLKNKECSVNDLVVMRTHKVNGIDTIQASAFKYPDIFPLKRYHFDGINVNGPSNYDAVLTKRYSEHYKSLPNAFGYSGHINSYSLD